MKFDPAVAPIKPSRWQRLKWAIEWRMQAMIDWIEEAAWRIRKAWRALRYG